MIAQVALKKGFLSPAPGGGLSIWEWPVENGQYGIGVDSSAGIRGGDFSCAEVLELHTCRQVAEWHGLYEPQRWGCMVSRLGWLYNTAALAIETHPSPHGLMCWETARAYGYENLWNQTKWDMQAEKTHERKGWIRTPHSTVDLLNHIRVALGEGCVIRSKRLIAELREWKLDEDGKSVGGKHDDCVMAYSMALMLRRDAFLHGVVSGEAPVDFSNPAALYWKDVERRRDEWANLRPKFRTEEEMQEEAWNGID